MLQWGQDLPSANIGFENMGALSAVIQDEVRAVRVILVGIRTFVRA